jgi:hypothetical protein
VNALEARLNDLLSQRGQAETNFKDTHNAKSQVEDLLTKGKSYKREYEMQSDLKKTRQAELDSILTKKALHQQESSSHDISILQTLKKIQDVDAEYTLTLETLETSKKEFLFKEQKTALQAGQLQSMIKYYYKNNLQ